MGAEGKKDKWICPNCGLTGGAMVFMGADNNIQYIYCCGQYFNPECKPPIPKDIKFCPSCGEANIKVALNCYKCGWVYEMNPPEDVLEGGDA